MTNEEHFQEGGKSYVLRWRIENSLIEVGVFEGNNRLCRYSASDETALDFKTTTNGDILEALKHLAREHVKLVGK